MKRLLRNIVIQVHEEKDEIAAKKSAAEVLEGLLKKYKQKPMLLMLSGGSAMGLLDFVDTASFGKHVTITVLDERHSKDPKVNNFAQLVETEFYRNLKEKKGIDFRDTQVQGRETLERLTERFGDYIEEWIRSYQPEADEKIIITQGIGEDGHTAGIMPYPENPELFRKLFADPKRWVAGYDAGKKNPYPLRVTVNLPFLRQKVDHSIVYIVGENKRKVLERVLAGKGTLQETPARIIHEMKNVELFTNL